MVEVAVDRIVPISDARERLSEIVASALGNRFWVIIEGGKPKAAVVDLQFLNDLIRRAWFDELSAKTHAAFREYLIRKGLNPDTMSEAEIEAIIQS